eukprot:gene125-171_t
MTVNQKIIKPKMGLLELAKKLGNVSTTCKILGYSRDSYYRFKELYDQGEEEALYEISRKKLLLAKIESSIEKNELKKQGILISAGEVKSVWLRNDLNNRPSAKWLAMGIWS